MFSKRWARFSKFEKGMALPWMILLFIPLMILASFGAFLVVMGWAEHPDGPEVPDAGN